MGIVTKTGDGGETSLWSGERVEKDSLRVNSFGMVDELSAFLADAKHLDLAPGSKEMIASVQRDLFKAAASLASNAPPRDPVTAGDVLRLEEEVTRFEAKIGLKGFVVPGAVPESSRLDICRTIARRAERAAVALSHAESVDANVLCYLNRLSDLLFMLARNEEWRRGKIEYH